MLVSVRERTRRGWGLFFPCCCGGGCPVCNVTICVNNCGVPVSGASVSIFGGASGTTGAGGCVTLFLGTPGLYTVSATKAPFGTVTQDFNLTCCGSATLDFSAIEICVFDICGNPIGNATVKLINGGFSVSGNADLTTGCVDFSVPSATYTVEITTTCGTCTYPGQALACGNSYNFFPTCTITGPTVLTDANGTWTLCNTGGNPLTCSFQYMICYDIHHSNLCTGTHTTTSVSYGVNLDCTNTPNWQADVKQFWQVNVNGSTPCYDNFGVCVTGISGCAFCDLPSSGNQDCATGVITLDKCTGAGSGNLTACSGNRPPGTPAGSFIVLS